VMVSFIIKNPAFSISTSRLAWTVGWVPSWALACGMVKAMSVKVMSISASIRLILGTVEIIGAYPTFKPWGRVYCLIVKLML